MNYHLFSGTLVRVGILVLTRSGSLLDDVGQGAWHRSGGKAVEEALPAEEDYSLIRLLVMPGGNIPEITQILKDWCDAPNRNYRCDIVLVIGGDGRGSHDGAPEAIRAIADRELAPFIEHLHAACIERSADSLDTRRRLRESTGSAAARNLTLIVNLPSCFDAPAETVLAVKPMLLNELQAIRLASEQAQKAADDSEPGVAA